MGRDLSRGSVPSTPGKSVSLSRIDHLASGEGATSSSRHYQPMTAVGGAASASPANATGRPSMYKSGASKSMSHLAHNNQRANHNHQVTNHGRLSKPRHHQRAKTAAAGGGGQTKRQGGFLAAGRVSHLLLSS